jgi:hypothetical protein
MVREFKVRIDVNVDEGSLIAAELRAVVADGIALRMDDMGVDAQIEVEEV